MPAERFYCDTELNVSEIYLGGQEFHHLSRVIRARKGDKVELVNGRGTLAQAIVITLEKEKALLQIESTTEGPRGAEIILAQAFPRFSHLDWIIEKGTELGASVFWLFPGVLSEKKTLSSHQEERLKCLAIAAMKQCGRLYLPSIQIKPPLESWAPIQGSLFYGATEKKAPLLPATNKFPIVLFIGPEKGFSPQEILFLEQTLKAKGVKLHDNILRTETAGIVGLAQLYLYTHHE